MWVAANIHAVSGLARGPFMRMEDIIVSSDYLIAAAGLRPVASAFGRSAPR